MNKGRILLLGFYRPRYIEPLRNWSMILTKKGWDVNQMYPDLYYKEDVLNEIIKDYDIIIYFGHGRLGAWCGFSSLKTNDLLRTQCRNSNKK